MTPGGCRDGHPQQSVQNEAYCRLIFVLISGIVCGGVESGLGLDLSRHAAAGLAGAGVPMLLRENCKFSIKISAGL